MDRSGVLIDPNAETVMGYCSALSVIKQMRSGCRVSRIMSPASSRRRASAMESCGAPATGRTGPPSRVDAVPRWWQHWSSSERPGDPKAAEATPQRRFDSVAIGRAKVCRSIAPGAAALDACRAVCALPCRPVGRSARVAGVTTILRPLPHVAVHVVQAVLSKRFRSLFCVRYRCSKGRGYNSRPRRILGYRTPREVLFSTKLISPLHFAVEWAKS
jgi:hypothetical protein